ncbi:MAG: hypothetical protein KBT28_11910 [Bacteroidales bacterium]|nr:hypothetical protein [Candidatus Colimorpha merdihippi]
MSQNNFSYPYPVLAVGTDDIVPALCKDNVILEPITKDDEGDYVLKLSLVMEDECLNNYIAEGVAEYIVEIDCPTTHYRRCIKSSSKKFEIKLPKREVANRVNFHPLLIARNDFKYSNPNFHEDYENEIFDMDLGDVLAVFNEFHYDFDIEYSNLKAYSSIMVFREAPEGQEEISYITDEDKIVIEMPAKALEQYRQFSQDPQYAPAIHASVVQSALVAVLLQEDWKTHIGDGDYELLWKRTIHYRVNHEEDLKKYRDLTEKENLFRLSQKLLRDPVQRMFDKITSEL